MNEIWQILTVPAFGGKIRAYIREPSIAMALHRAIKDDPIWRGPNVDWEGALTYPTKRYRLRPRRGFIATFEAVALNE